MITAIKKMLRAILFPTIYFGGFVVAIYSLFKNAWWGFIIYIALIPQPNIWYKFHELPLGKDFMDILFFSVFLGVFIQRRKIPKTSNTIIIVIFLINSYFSLWVSSLFFHLPMPATTSSWQLMEWKNYAQMIIIYFLTIAIVTDEDQQKQVFIIMSSILFFIALRNYRNFSGGSSFTYEKRVGGPFEFVGLGATHYGAFIAHLQAAFLGMSFFEQDKKKYALYIATFCICLHPLFFSYSRGAYLAIALVLVFYGLIKKPILLIGLFVIIIGWKVLLPESVVDRISGTKTESGELEGSAGQRFLIWDQAGNIISKSPLFGSGWESFGLSVPPEDRIHGLHDTHNYYIKVLCDRGIIGLLLLGIIFFKAFFSGLKLYRIGNSQFQKGLGFCFMGTVLACMATNMFGDRFTYFVVGSYFWLLWGLVDRGLLLAE